MNEDDGTKQSLRSRFDLAGRLLRPHWRMLRSALPASAGTSKSKRRGRGVHDETAGEHALDVICGGMYRACSTWQYEVVAHLIEQHKGGQRLGYMIRDEYAALRERDAAASSDQIRTTAGYRVIKSHDRDRSFAQAITDAKAMAIYAYRDVREVVFSLMHKRQMTFEQLLRHGMIHQILANDRFWMAQPDVLVQRYEDLIAEPARGVAELAHQLGIDLLASEAARIADEYSHEANRARTEALKRRLEQAGLDLDRTSNAQICDSKTLLHWNHIRQGDARSWHALANRRQRFVLHRLCGRWLKARGYPDDPNGKAVVTVFERISVEVEILMAAATYLFRSTSQRFPTAARGLKRMLGLADDTPAGATAWADAMPTHPRTQRTGEPHISFTAKTERADQDVPANEGGRTPAA
jgi:hypothetical protein